MKAFEHEPYETEEMLTPVPNHFAGVYKDCKK